jgi:hypothetical protein
MQRKPLIFLFTVDNTITLKTGEILVKAYTRNTQNSIINSTNNNNEKQNTYTNKACKNWISIHFIRISEQEKPSYFQH